MNDERTIQFNYVSKETKSNNPWYLATYTYEGSEKGSELKVSFTSELFHNAEVISYDYLASGTVTIPSLNIYYRHIYETVMNYRIYGHDIPLSMPSYFKVKVKNNIVLSVTRGKPIETDPRDWGNKWEDAIGPRSIGGGRKPKSTTWKVTAKTHTCNDGVKRKVYTDGKGAHAVKRKVGDKFVYRKMKM
jgi:hypothetical protein